MSVYVQVRLHRHVYMWVAILYVLRFSSAFMSMCTCSYFHVYVSVYVCVTVVFI